jgi:hypothetical protein
MCGAIPPFPQYVFMAWCLAKHRENFIFAIIMEIQAMFSSLSYWGCDSTASKNDDGQWDGYRTVNREFFTIYVPFKCTRVCPKFSGLSR